MSTPIKPPGGSPPGVGGSDAPDADRVEGRPGELRELVEQAEADVSAAATAQAASASPVARIHADLAAGRIDVDQAIDRLVQRALASASALPPGQLASLEAQLRAALVEDPTLAALRKDLERGSPT